MAHPARRAGGGSSRPGSRCVGRAESARFIAIEPGSQRPGVGERGRRPEDAPAPADAAGTERRSDY